MLLKRHGLFEESREFRLSRELSFVGEGKSSVVAKKLSWAAMHDHYCPIVESLELGGGVGGGVSSGEPGGRIVGDKAHLDGEYSGVEVSARVAEVLGGGGVGVPVQVDGECSLEDSIVWAGSNIRNARPDVKGCPSQQAWLLWDAYRDNPSRFVEQIWSKHFMGKLSLEEQSRMSDDGRSNFRLIARLEASREKAIADEEAKRGSRSGG